MAKFEITGRIEKMSAKTEVPTQNGSIAKREIIITKNNFDRFTGEPIGEPDHIAFEFAGKHVDKLDNFNVGDMVTLAFALAGRNYTDKEGNEKNFTKVVGYDIQPYASRRVERPAAPAPATPEVVNDELPF